MPLPDAAWHAAFRRRLRAWFPRHKRELPWRSNRDPYAIWISEMMLQQTQVAMARPFFERFIARLPTIAALAEADEHEVLRLWEGLGYYRRARQLHQAAKIIVRDHDGVFPPDPAAVMRLPGIGRYTAGAVLSIAYDLRLPILEANTIRVFSRLLGYRGDPAGKEGSRLLWGMAEAVLPQRQVGAFNQALMELGSIVCLPRSPQCDRCPVAPQCAARRDGLQAEIPAPKVRRPPEPRHEVAVIVRRRGRVLLVQCPEGGRWGGLWDFPRFQVEAGDPDEIARQARSHVERLTGVEIEPGRRLHTLRHGVTRFRITLDCYEAEYVAHRNGHRGPPMRWLRPAELADYPLNVTARKLAKLASQSASVPPLREAVRPPSPAAARKPKTAGSRMEAESRSRRGASDGKREAAGVLIRRADGDDIDAVASLWEDLIDWHHQLDPRFWIRADDARERYREWMVEAIEADDRILLVAQCRGGIVGFLHGMLEHSPPVMAPKFTGYISDIIVVSDCRQRGVGRGLVEAATMWFQAQGAVEMALNVVLGNREAEAFWQSLGFEARTILLWKTLL